MTLNLSFIVFLIVIALSIISIFFYTKSSNPIKGKILGIMMFIGFLSVLVITIIESPIDYVSVRSIEKEIEKSLNLPKEKFIIIRENTNIYTVHTEEKSFVIELNNKNKILKKFELTNK